MLKSYFLFFRLMHYTAFLMAIKFGLCICYLPSHFAHRGITSFFVFLCMALFRRASFLTTFCGLYFQSSLHIITNYSSSLYRPSVGSFSCTAIQGIRQLAYFRTNTGKTLGKLHWKSKISLKRNGMAAIPKNYYLFCLIVEFVLQDKNLTFLSSKHETMLIITWPRSK